MPPYLSYPGVFLTNPGTGRAGARGWRVFRDPPRRGDAYSWGAVSAVVPRGVWMHVARGGLQEDNPAAMAPFAWWCWGGFGRGGCLKPGGF